MNLSALAVIHISIDPVIHLGPLAIHWYGVMYAVAFTVAFRFAAVPHLVPRGISQQDCERIAVMTIVAGLIGARLYYDVQQPLGQYVHNPLSIIAVWEGGMDFFGAIFGSVAMMLYLTLREHRSFWLLFDAGVLFAVVGQPLGRIGNIINGDILGGPSDAPWATAYTNPHAILQSGYFLNVPYQPAGAYEAVTTIAIGIGLYALRRRRPRDGVLAMTYFGAYAVTQFLLFYVRQSEPVVGWGLKQSQWTSIAMVVIGLPFMIWIWRRGEAGDEAAEATPLAS